MRLSTLIYVAFVVMCIPHAYGQKQGQALIDSLLKELPSIKVDTDKSITLTRIGFAYAGISPDEGIKYATRGLEQAKKAGWEKGEADADNILGINYAYKSDYTKSLAYWNDALRIYEQTGNKKGILKVVGNMGNAYSGQGDYPRALELDLKALKLSEELGNTYSIMLNLGNIGSIYEALGNFEKALEYDQKALKLSRETGDKGTIGMNLGNIGNIYVDKKEYEEALKYDLEALKVYEELGGNEGIGRNLFNIGRIYMAQRKYAEALRYVYRSLELFSRLGYKIGMGKSWGLVGEICVKMASDSSWDYKAQRALHHEVADSALPVSRAACLAMALENLHRGIKVETEAGELDDLHHSYHDLSAAQRLIGNYQGAFESYKQYVLLKDSIYSEANKIKVTNLETQREIELKDKQIQINRIDVMKKRNERTYFIIGMALLAVVIGVVLRNVYLQKRSNKQLSGEKERSEDLLLNILPAEVASELKEKGMSPARHFDNVTILYTDFVNFTQAGEQLSAQDLVEELHTCFKAFDEITSRYGIEKIKTIGDAYLAAAGLANPDVNHSEHVVMAAIDIRNFMDERRSLHGTRTFEIRIGVHSGSVVAGIVGVKKFAYDLWGDTVNIASIIEQESEPGKVGISESVYAEVKDNFVCVFNKEITTRNKGEMKMYFIEKKPVLA